MKKDLDSAGATRLLWALTVAVGCIVSLAGCASTPRAPALTELHPFTSEERAQWSAAKDARYRLRVGDMFTVDFKYQDELDQRHISILPDGRFTMAGMEDVHAAGLTVQELDSLVTAHFARDYRNAELSIVIEELGRQQVYVLGEVMDPGAYDLPKTGAGVLQAVTLAGGFAKNAAPGHTVMIRATPEGFLYRRLDLSHLEKRGLRDMSVLDLQPYDIVYVPRSAVGDLAHFSENVLSGMLSLTGLFWDVYAVTNLDRVNIITR